MNEQLNSFDYIDEAHVTASNKYYGDQIPLHYFAEVVANAVEALNELDVIKKALFYGRAGVAPPTTGETSLNRLPDWIKIDTGEGLNSSEEARQNAVNIIHGIIGKATEAGELLEALAATATDGGIFDGVNAIEEVGDGFWYDAILLRALNSSFEEAQTINIAKLRKRFPNAFSEFDANNRDLFEERKILEKGA